MLNLVRLLLLKACKGILAHNEGKCPVSGLYVDHTIKQQTAQLDGLFREDGLRGIMRGRNYYASDIVFPFVAPFIHKIFGFVERCSLTTMTVLYTEMANKVLFDQSGGAWVEGESVRLWSEIWKLKRVAGKTFCCALLIWFAQADVSSSDLSCGRL